MGFFDILGAFVPLIIIVALLYGVLIFVKKYGYNLKGKEFSPLDIKVISTKMIMPKRFISVIKVQDKLLVLGVSEHSINLLKELESDIEDSKTDNTAETWNSGVINSGGSFFNILKKNIGIK
ncbi:MAG: flagellar biosynthetic protein FliO [Ignavibacteriaceae bacterium]